MSCFMARIFPSKASKAAVATTGVLVLPPWLRLAPLETHPEWLDQDWTAGSIKSKLRS